MKGPSNLVLSAQFLVFLISDDPLEQNVSKPNFTIEHFKAAYSQTVIVFPKAV